MLGVNAEPFDFDMQNLPKSEIIVNSAVKYITEADYSDTAEAKAYMEL